MTTIGEELSVKSLRDLAGNSALDESDWDIVEQHAQAIADSLRSTDAATRRQALGNEDLQVSLAKLLQSASAVRTPIKDNPLLPTIHQLLRVSANFCADSDSNRIKLLQVQVPSLVLEILGDYRRYYSDRVSISDLSPDNLRIIKTAIGVLINASYEFQPVAKVLMSNDAPLCIIEISTKLYPPVQHEIQLDAWELLRGIGSWAWKLLSVLRDVNQDSGVPTLDHRALPYLMKYFSNKLEPTEMRIVGVANQNELDEQTFAADLEALEESSIFIESLSLDSEVARREMASDEVLKPLIEFIENGNYPESWSKASAVDRRRMQKTFDVCKGVLITAVTSIAGEILNSDVLWSSHGVDELRTGNAEPSSWFTAKMLNWIRSFSPGIKCGKNSREDLVICGTLCIGNLVRADSRAMKLVKVPYDIVPHIIDLLDEKIDIKVKNGAVGLLKNLSQPESNRRLLGEQGVIEALAASEIWQPNNDMAEIVQTLGIGVCKHLANRSAVNSIKISIVSEGRQSCLDQILALVDRSDTTAVKSEGTRVLVNVIRALLSHLPMEGSDVGYKEAIRLVAKPEYSLYLAELLVRSHKYPLLVNESLVSMTLISVNSNHEGVLSAIMALNIDSQQHSEAKDESSSRKYDGVPPFVAVLIDIIINRDNKFSAEIRANACALVTAVTRHSGGGIKSDQSTIFKDLMRKPLEVAKINVNSSQRANFLKESIDKAIAVL